MKICLVINPNAGKKQGLVVAQNVTDRLTEEDEARTLDAWISFLREAVRTGGSMRDIDVMAAIERYNEIDCRVMAEILAWLRLER